MLITECPVCRTPLRWTYILRTLWSRWRCAHCGSLLGVDVKRRLLAAGVGAGVILAGSITLTRAGWSDLAAPFLMLLFYFPVLLVIDRVNVIERCGFRCRTCGYDLRGQVAPRCPECGREFDADERAILETGVLPPSVHRPRRAVVVVAVLIFLFLGTLFAVGVTYFRAFSAGPPPTTTTSAPAAGAAPSGAGQTPLPATDAGISGQARPADHRGLRRTLPPVGRACVRNSSSNSAISAASGASSVSGC